MSRVRLEIPRSLPFSITLRVRIDDVNYGGHLSNDAMLRLAHEARLRFLAGLGLSEMDAAGCALIMADAALVFSAQAFHGDELRVELGPCNLARASFDLLYRFTRLGDGAEVARVKTGMVCFDYRSERVVGMPAELRRALETGRR